MKWLAPLLAVVFFAYPVYALASFVYGTVVYDQPDNSVLTPLPSPGADVVDIKIPAPQGSGLLSSNSWNGAIPTYAVIHVAETTGNDFFTQAQVVYHRDLGCSLGVGYNNVIPGFSDPANTATHEVFYDLTSTAAATSGVKCIEVDLNATNGHSTSGSFYESNAGGNPTAQVATSLFIQTPSTTTPAAYGPPTGTSTPVIGCTDSNFVQNSFCSLFQYLFIPQPSSLSAYATLSDSLKNKPPFGYPLAVSSVISILASTTVATSTTFGGYMAVERIAPWLFQPIDFTFASILTFAFLMWFFHRFRKFNFTSP